MNDIIEHIIEIKANLSGLNEKCDGICRRLDISNGKIAKSETALTELKTESAYKKGMHTVIISAIGVGITLITNFVLRKF